jgi:DNA-binding NarL/FixJ family response regulator
MGEVRLGHAGTERPGEVDRADQGMTVDLDVDPFVGQGGHGRRIRIFVVDNHQLFAEALAARLNLEKDLVVVGAAANAHDALMELSAAEPEVAIVEVALRQSGADRTAHGLELVSLLRQRRPGLQVVVVTGHVDAATALGALRVGATGFVPKGAPIDDLVKVLRGVLVGETHIPPRLLTAVLNALWGPPVEAEWARRLARLTAREREVLEEMVAGIDQATVAERLFLSLNTVRTHTKHILAKLEVHSSLEAVSIGLRAGLRPGGSIPGTGRRRTPAGRG